MYIDQSVFTTPSPQIRQSFNPVELLGQGLSSLNPYNVAWDIINYKNKRRSEEYAKALQKHLEEREDTAYQRTAEDMYKAGLNPLSMQGTDNAGSAISMPDMTSGTPADSIATTIEKFVNNANNTMLAFDTIKNSENDRKLNTMRTLNEIANIRSNIENTNLDSKAKKQLLNHMEREYKYMETNHLYDYDNGIAQQIKSVVSYLTTDLPKVKEKLEKQYPFIKTVSDFITTGKLPNDTAKKLKEEHPLWFFLLNEFSNGALSEQLQEPVLNTDGTTTNSSDSSHESGTIPDNSTKTPHERYLDATRPKWWRNLFK